MPANLENSVVAIGFENISFHSNPKERQYLCSKYHTTAFISDASKVMLKVLQARLQQYVDCELPDVQAGFRKSRGTRDQTANIHWIIKKAREFQKNILTHVLKSFSLLEKHLAGGRCDSRGVSAKTQGCGLGETSSNKCP